MGKGEIASYEQFFLFPHCFQKTCTADVYKLRLVWERVNSLPKDKIVDKSKFKAHADDKRNVK